MIGILATTIMGVAVMFYRWYLLTVLWAWFIVPQFGMPLLLYWQVAGISLFWSLFTYKHDEKDRTPKEFLTFFVSYALGMTIFMGMAWAIKLFI